MSQQTYHTPLIAGAGGELAVDIFDNARDRGRVTLTACALDLRTVPLVGAAAEAILTAAAGDVPEAGVARLKLSAGNVATIAPFAPATCEFRFLFSQAGEVDRYTDWVRVELRA